MKPIDVFCEENSDSDSDSAASEETLGSEGDLCTDTILDLAADPEGPPIFPSMDLSDAEKLAHLEACDVIEDHPNLK